MAMSDMERRVDAAQWEHPPVWWFKVAQRLFPDRCREIPEAVNPARIVLRQFALVKRSVYLQQFAGPEDPRWMHSHQWKRTIAIGLWGWYLEVRQHPNGWYLPQWRRAPYLYTMDEKVVHRVDVPSKGHTSIFIGLWRDDDLKNYHSTETGAKVPWFTHILKQVKRI
jgi:hypothetical protein